MTKQRRRSDYGTVRATERDLLCLKWIGEQYTIRLDHLQYLAGRYSDRELQEPDKLSYEGTRNLVYKRWFKAGWIEKQKILAHEPIWIWLTKKGLHAVELGYGYREPAVGRLSHIWHANEARLLIERIIKDDGWWMCDREVNTQRKSLDKKHMIDGEVYYRDEIIGIEVEISRKSDRRLIAICQELQHDYKYVWYIVNDECKSAIERATQIVDPRGSTFVVRHFDELTKRAWSELDGI